MRRLLVAASLALACALAAPVRAEEAVSRTRPESTRGSPLHLAVSGELLLGGELAEVPLTLYGMGVEAGYRLRAPNGLVSFTPLLAVHLMRGHTPAGLLFTSTSYGGGVDLALERPSVGVHLLVELGRSENTFHLATSTNEYEVRQLTGQALVALTYRVSPWFTLRAGLGYRGIGQIGGAVLVLGGTL
jgi:hypothetical protein